MAYVLEPRPKNTAHVLIAAELDSSRLAYVPQPDSQVARLEVNVVAVSHDSGRRFRHDDVVELSAQAHETPGWRALVHEFELPADVTQVRVVVRDTISGSMDSVSQRFEIPLADVFHVSTPI